MLNALHHHTAIHMMTFETMVLYEKGLRKCSDQKHSQQCLDENTCVQQIPLQYLKFAVCSLNIRMSQGWLDGQIDEFISIQKMILCRQTQRWIYLKFF